MSSERLFSKSENFYNWFIVLFAGSILSLPFIRKKLWRRIYNWAASPQNDSTSKLKFFNYGYAESNKISFQGQQDFFTVSEILSGKLYEFLASQSEQKSSEIDVLEIGCGRGGGAALIHQKMHYNSTTAVDLSEENVSRALDNFHDKNLHFKVGNAESLTFKNNSFDIVFNVESLHCYDSVSKFFKEVHRVLKPNGEFIFCDLLPKNAIDKIVKNATNHGFALYHKEQITGNVLNARDLVLTYAINESRSGSLSNFNKNMFVWAALKGTPIYEFLEKGNLEYWMVKFIKK